MNKNYKNCYVIPNWKKVEERYGKIEYPGAYLFCIEDDENELTLMNRDKKTIKLSKENVTYWGPLDFMIGDKVRRKFDNKIGIIYDIHHVSHYDDSNKDYIAYYVDLEDHKSKRRTRAEELEKIK